MSMINNNGKKIAAQKLFTLLTLFISLYMPHISKVYSVVFFVLVPTRAGLQQQKCKLDHRLLIEGASKFANLIELSSIEFGALNVCVKCLWLDSLNYGTLRNF